MTNNVSVSGDALHKEPTDRPPRFYNVRLSESDAWHGTSVAALFNALGMLIEIAIIRQIPNVTSIPAAVSVSVGVVLLATLFVRRKRPSVKLASFLYLVNAASVITALLFTNTEFAVSEKFWTPFQESKLGCLIAAMVAPGFWVGLASILGHSLSAVMQFEFFFPAEIKTHVAAAEPWPTLAFGLGGVLALVYRFRRAQLEQELARTQAENFAIRRMANAFLNIRDLMNTPLQVIEISVKLLRNSNQPSRDVLDRIDRSVRSLSEINSLLVENEQQIEWRPKE
jgi:hypothetical protein